MKTYLDFTLEPRKFLNIWLLFYVLVLIPYGWYMYRASSGTIDMDHAGRILLLMLLVMLFALGIYFYIVTIFIEHIRLGEKKVEFTSAFSSYLNIAIPGFLLSFVSLGIYMAWFVKDIVNFFTRSSQLDGEPFQFHGEARRLFVILLASLFLPVLVMAMITIQLSPEVVESTWFKFVNQALSMIVLVPYMYLVWVWIMNFQHKDQYIYLNTSFSESGLVILKELGLTIITLGIYFPMMYLRLYTHFAERTIVAKEGSYRTFGYDLEAGDDFVFIWMQTLMCIGTLGIYVPWAFCKIGKRVLSKTYLTESITVD
jgi:uncharacterized membrane protein YjgN (DUF898 family)